jgi:protein CpxP
MTVRSLPALALLATLSIAGGATGALAADPADTMPPPHAQATPMHRGQAPHARAPMHHGRQGQRTSNSGGAATSADQLNAQSLERARMGESSPSGAADTTRNLNRMSGQDAQDNMNTGRDPLVPFR